MPFKKVHSMHEYSNLLGITFAPLLDDSIIECLVFISFVVPGFESALG